PAASGGWSIWNSDYQSLTYNQPFLVTNITNVTFKCRYYLYSSVSAWQRAYLQIRRATQDTWNTISTFSGGPFNSWQAATVASSVFTPYSGSSCYLRFVVTNLTGTIYSYYTTTVWWPWNGFAFDEFAINNAGFASFSWSTVDNAIPSTSTSTTFTGKSAGTYAYKVAGYANSAWQNWSNVEDVLVSFASTTVVGGGPIGASSEWEATGFNNGRRMVRDSNGYFHALWHTQWPISTPSAANCQIFYSYTTVTAMQPPSMAAQGKWAMPINMSSTLNFWDNRYPSVAIAYDIFDNVPSWKNTNVLHVVWQAMTTSASLGGRYEVFYARITVNSYTSTTSNRPPTAPTPWTLPAVRNLSNTTTDSLVPAIAINQHSGVANQHLHVVWQEEDYNGIVAPAEDAWFSDILYRRSTTSGATWTAIQNLTNSPMNSQMPSIACILDQYTVTPATTGRNDFGYNSDDVHVSYNEDIGPGIIHVFYLRSLNDGVVWNPRVDVSVGTGGVLDAYPNIAVDMTDNPHITFMRYNITQFEPLRTGAPGIQYLPGINPMFPNSFPGPDIGMYGSKTNVVVYAYSTTTGANWYWLDFATSNDCEFPTVALDRWQHTNVNWQEFNGADYEIMRVTRLNTFPPTFPILLPKYAGTWSTATSDSMDLDNDDLFPNLAERKVAQYMPGYDEVWTKLTGHGVMAATTA
ncbi:MAG: hypothetical protein QME64_06415, partial [bacterium]|nr:hypothetical protein [bacterium]